MRCPATRTSVLGSRPHKRGGSLSLLNVRSLARASELHGARVPDTTDRRSAAMRSADRLEMIRALIKIGTWELQGHAQIESDRCTSLGVVLTQARCGAQWHDCVLQRAWRSLPALQRRCFDHLPAH